MKTLIKEIIGSTILVGMCIFIIYGLVSTDDMYHNKMECKHDHKSLTEFMGR